MKAYISSIALPGSPVIFENPLPSFRDRNYDFAVGIDESLPPEYFENAGKNLAYRVLPYKMQDNYYRKRDINAVKTAVLENDIMTATFLPDFGGRLYSLYNKRDKRELLFCNPVFQPANIAIRNAWISGGIEWNIGRTGHTYHTSAPVFFQKCTGVNGEEFLRMFEYDRCEGLCFSIDFRLPEGSGALYAQVKITNSRDVEVPMYWWTNTAVRETPDMRVLASAGKAIYLRSKSEGGGFGLGEMPYLASAQGRDASFPSVYDHATEYFFQTPTDVKHPWEAALYPSENWFFAEYSTCELKYRKMFTWGSHQGGRKWRDFLSDPGKGDYIEIQAGLARTQLHGLVMPANAVWTFTQAFTSVSADIAALAKMDYSDAAAAAASLFTREFPEFAPEKPGAAEYISFGSGWGALEQRRRKMRGERGLPVVFPDGAIGGDELPWLNLLLNGRLPDNTYSFMTGADWRDMLEKDAAVNNNREARVHLGVMYCEDGLDNRAAAAWEAGLPHALAYRNLSLAEIKNNNIAKATEYMEKAVKLNGSDYYKSEYAELLIKTGEYEKCWDLLYALSDDAPSRMWIHRAQCAWHTGRYAELEAMFGREYSCIREGENALTDLWFKWAEKTGQANKTDPPPHIDFRMQ